MQERFIIATRMKKTISYIDTATMNFPHKDQYLRNKIMETTYDMLEILYRANIKKDVEYKKEVLVQMKMLEYYVKTCLDKKLINYRKFEVIGNNLLDINVMVRAWIKNEKKE